VRSFPNSTVRYGRFTRLHQLKPIYPVTAEAAEQALDAFESGPWGKQYHSKLGFSGP
jgi:hypothetical protein